MPDEKRLVVHTCAEDTGGQCYRTKEAFSSYSQKWSARCLVLAKNYLDYPVDILYNFPNLKRGQDLIEKASLIHIHNKYTNYLAWKLKKENIPVIIHQHSARWGNIESKKEDQKWNAIRVVSTIDILEYVDYNVERWIPSPVDDIKLSEMRKNNYISDGKIRICHCPTNRQFKHTDIFLGVFAKLKKIHPEIELVLVEKKKNIDVLNQKSRCDILYDQLDNWYGNNAIEAWAFGIPAIVGMAEKTRDISIKKFGYEPWCFANDKDSLYKVLDELICDEKYRRKMGELGKKHIIKYHSFKNVVPLIEKIYEIAT